MSTIYTIGHSANDFDEFCNTLKSFGVQKVIDVRSYPGSRHVPAFNKENLEVELPIRRIEYAHFRKLGGRRKSYCKDDYLLVDGWKNQSFKNYASYTLTKEYEEGISELLAAAEIQTICIMCAESVPWKCHRLLISNTLADRGIEVVHIMGKGVGIPHELNRFGAAPISKNGRIIYPKQQ